MKKLFRWITKELYSLSFIKTLYKIEYIIDGYQFLQSLLETKQRENYGDKTYKKSLEKCERK